MSRRMLPSSFNQAPTAAQLSRRADKMRKLDRGDERPMTPEEQAEDDVKNQAYVDTLTGTTEGVVGIMRTRTRRKLDREGRRNWPYRHQRKCAKRMHSEQQKRLLVCHDPGTGKTFTFLLAMCGLHTLGGGRRRKTLVTAPASCIVQWQGAMLDTLRIPEGRILATNQQKKLTAKAIAEHDVIITSRNLVGLVYQKSHQWVKQHHQNERGNWCSAWDAIPGKEHHPLLTTSFDMMCIDEVHALRNSLTGWTKGHELIASHCTKVVGMSATPVYNKPEDLVGISTGMYLPVKYRDSRSWFLDNKGTKINTELWDKFNSAYVDRCSDKVLGLPPITDHYRTFDAGMNPQCVDEYNEAVAAARSIRCAVQRRNGQGSKEEFTKLMAYLQTLQQFLVSPLLAKTGAKGATEAILERASREETGAKTALRETVQELNREGYDRVMVACCHTSLMYVAKLYLEREAPSVGNVLVYEGSLTLKQREQITERFLNGERTVLLLSIEAGGTGLHLVPGSNAVVFWGSRPYTPMAVLQCKKRVHRIGQDKPVKVVHLISDGSVDAAIQFVHKDKEDLANTILDQDLSGLKAKGGRWRTTGRIVDRCKFLSPEGQFHLDGATEQAMLNRNARRINAATGNVAVAVGNADGSVGFQPAAPANPGALGVVQNPILNPNPNQLLPPALDALLQQAGLSHAAFQNVANALNPMGADGYDSSTDVGDNDSADPDDPLSAPGLAL